MVCRQAAAVHGHRIGRHDCIAHDVWVRPLVDGRQIHQIVSNGLDARGTFCSGFCFGPTVGRLAMTSIPSLNVTPRTSFRYCLVPSRRRQLFRAASSNLKTIARANLLDRQPFDRIVRWRTVAKVLSIGLVVRKRF
jgi:hypothetical protein